MPKKPYLSPQIPGGIIGTRVRPTLALVYMNMTHVLSAVPRASPVFLDLSRVTLLDHAATEVSYTQGVARHHRVYICYML